MARRAGMMQVANVTVSSSTGRTLKVSGSSEGTWESNKSRYPPLLFLSSLTLSSTLSSTRLLARGWILRQSERQSGKQKKEEMGIVPSGDSDKNECRLSHRKRIVSGKNEVGRRAIVTHPLRWKGQALTWTYIPLLRVEDCGGKRQLKFPTDDNYYSRVFWG